MRFLPRFALLCFSTLAGQAQAGSVDDLLRLVPRDAGATLVVENLRGHAQSFFDSPLADGLSRVPVIKDWRNSEGSVRLETARRDIERALGIDLNSIRDDMLGEAFVLTVHAGPGKDPSEASGLFLTKVRSRALLDRLIAVLNAAARGNGELAEVVRRDHGGKGTYYQRRFRPGTKPDNWYAIINETTFAWTNSESLIRGVIDRKAGNLTGLDSHPDVRRVRDGLPRGPVASLLIDPAFVGRLIGADRAADKEPQRRLQAYLQAIRYAGLAVEWRDGLLAAHLHAVYNPASVPEPHRRWASLKLEGSAPVMPADALAFASIPVDFRAVGDLYFDPVPGQDRARLENIQTAVNGFLGRDLRREVLPFVRPNVRMMIRNPGRESSRWPIVLTAAVTDEGVKRGVPSAIENALKTMFAFLALEPARANQGRLVETSEMRGILITRLSGPPPIYSFASDRGQLALGNSPEAVLWALGGDPASTSGHPGFERARAAYFPEARGVAFFDIDAAVAWALIHRQAIVDRLAAGRIGSEVLAARDLDNTLAFGTLFHAAFLTGSVSPGFEEAHIRLGLVVKAEK